MRFSTRMSSRRHNGSTGITARHARHVDSAYVAAGPRAWARCRAGRPAQFGGSAANRGGSLYPALHRLENQGLIVSEWKASDLNRRAKYYRLTARGRKRWAAEQSKWNLLVKTMARVMCSA